MRRYLLFLLVASTFCAAPLLSHAVSVEPVPVQRVFSFTGENPKAQSLKVKDVEKLLGRKLRFKEKVSLFILRTFRPAASSKAGQTALIFGISAAALFFLALLVPVALIPSLLAGIVAIVVGTGAKRDDRSDKKARAGALLGWITVGLIVALVILAAAVLSGWN